MPRPTKLASAAGRVHQRGVGISNGQKPTLDCERLSRCARSAPKDAYAVRYFGRSHRRAQCRWLWHRRLRRIRVEKPSGAGLPLLPRAAILKALVGPADTIWWATL